MRFLTCIEQYEGLEIDFGVFVQTKGGKEIVFGNEVIQLKTNKIPKWLVILERVFDNQVKARTAIAMAHPEDLEEINIGIEGALKMVYIGKKMSPKVRKLLIDLLRKYRHVFAWSYDDLKAYREDLFLHEIPLKEGAKPFRKKKMLINPTLVPKMQEELVKLRDVGIIKPIRHSSWVSNLALMRKKN